MDVRNMKNDLEHLTLLMSVSWVMIQGEPRETTLVTNCRTYYCCMSVLLPEGDTPWLYQTHEDHRGCLNTERPTLCSKTRSRTMTVRRALTPKRIFQACRHCLCAQRHTLLLPRRWWGGPSVFCSVLEKDLDQVLCVHVYLGSGNCLEYWRWKYAYSFPLARLLFSHLQWLFTFSMYSTSKYSIMICFIFLQVQRNCPMNHPVI